MNGQLEFTVAHEVAHQYFAGLVGNDSRRFPSIDEPMAQYAAALVIEDMYGREAADAAMYDVKRSGKSDYAFAAGSQHVLLKSA